VPPLTTEALTLSTDVRTPLSLTHEEQMNNLVSKIVTHAPDVHLIVGQIIPFGDQHVAQNARVYEFNTYIRDTIVPTYAAGGANISTVDHYSLFLSDPNDPTSVQDGLHTVNEVHPTNAMYDEMGQAWFQEIKALTKVSRLGTIFYGR
jgi:hypothetical protein